MFFIKIEVVFIAYCLKKIWRGKGSMLKLVYGSR